MLSVWCYWVPRPLCTCTHCLLSVIIHIIHFFLVFVDFWAYYYITAYGRAIIIRGMTENYLVAECFFFFMFVAMSVCHFVSWMFLSMGIRKYGNMRTTFATKLRGNVIFGWRSSFPFPVPNPITASDPSDPMEMILQFLWGALRRATPPFMNSFRLVTVQRLLLNVYIYDMYIYEYTFGRTRQNRTVAHHLSKSVIVDLHGLERGEQEQFCCSGLKADLHFSKYRNILCILPATPLNTVQSTF